MVVAATAAQAANQVNVRLALPSTDFNPCTNELVDSNVRIHIVVNATMNANNVSGTFHLNFNAKGVGQTTGASYVGSESDNEPFSASLSNGRAVIHAVNRFIFTTPGGSNNWVVRVVSHVTIDASGEVTASFEQVADETCR